MTFRRGTMAQYHFLTNPEKAWVKKYMPEVTDEVVDEETYNKIAEGMKKGQEDNTNTEQDKESDNKENKTSSASDTSQTEEKITEEEKQPEEENKQETALALVVSQMGAEQNQEEKQPDSEKPAVRSENTAITLYSVDKALGFFERYAEEKGYTFNRDPIDDAVAGSFKDADKNEQGRISVKDNNASSDIKGIDALVQYAKEAGYDNITLGECSPEYAEEMKKACEKYGIKLMGRDNENIEQNIQKNENQNVEPDNQVAAIALPAGKEKNNQEEIEQSEQTAIPLSSGNSEEKTPEITVEEGRSKEPTYKTHSQIAEVKLQRYLAEAKEKPERFAEEMTNSEKAYNKGWYAQTGEEKAFSDILLHKYAKAVVHNEDKSQIEKALQLYGVDTISIEPDNNPQGKVKVTSKNFADRSPEEQAEIKTAHDKLLPQKDRNNSGKMQQNQPITKEDGGR